MNKYLVVGLVAVGALAFYVMFGTNNETPTIEQLEHPATTSDYKDISYTIAGESVLLTDGYNEHEASLGHFQILRVVQWF